MELFMLSVGVPIASSIIASITISPRPILKFSWNGTLLLCILNVTESHIDE